MLPVQLRGKFDDSGQRELKGLFKTDHSGARSGRLKCGVGGGGFALAGHYSPVELRDITFQSSRTQR